MGESTRRTVWVACLCLLAVALLWAGAVSCGGQGFEAGRLGAVQVAPGEAIQIRSMHVLTGLGDLGAPSQRGVAMALADYGPVKGHDVEMGAGLDSLCTEEGGRAAADAVIGDPRVVGVIGTSCSVAATAVSPILSEAGLVMISSSNTAPSLTSDLRGNAGSNYHPGYYRTSSNDLHEARAVAQFAYNDLGLRRMAAIHDGDPYITGLTGAFTTAFGELGGSVAVASVSRGDTDMVPVLTQLAAGSPDGLFFPLFQEEGAHIVQQVGQIAGLEDVTLIGGAALLVSEFLAIPESEGVYFPGPELSFGGNTNEATGKSGEALIADYRERYGEAPTSAYLAHAYDAATMLLRAIDEVAVGDGDALYIDRAKLREALAGVAGFRGIIGVISCDQQRTALAILRTIRSSNEAAGRSPEESGASKPTPRLIIRRGSMSAAHECIRYEAVAGPIRAELLDTERLEPTGLGLWDVQLQKGDEGRRVYALPGVPLERGFLVRSAEKGVYSDIWYLDPETAYPVCQPGAHNFFFVAKGASPQPTPVPTPDTSGISTVLSSEGLLGAGWPLVNMANLQIEFRGVEYTYADRSYSGGYVPIEELETLAIAYPVEIGRLPYPALEELATGGMVVDHVRIYRFSERPINEVIVIDQCPSDLRGDHFVLYLPTRGGSNDNDGDSSSVPTPTPEPRPVSFDDHVMPPEYVRLDFDNQIVVAFVDDQGLGRVAYVTHVPTGAQAVLNNKGKVVERHSGTGNGDAILEVTLSDADAMSQIQGGFLYEEDLSGNGFMDWVNFIRFGGSEYLSKGKRGGGDQVEKSRLGEVLYRVAFHVDANLVPGDYRPRTGDAAFLSPGTAIHSVDGYSPSEVLAAVVDGEVWLFDRPGPAISIPTPAVVPGEPQIDRHEEAEQRLRRAMANFPAGHIDWVDEDTVVYVLAADPHDLAGTKVAVAHYLPTSAAITYSLNKVENRWSLFGTRCPSIPTPAVWSTGSVEASSGPLGTTRYELSMCCEG